MGPVANVEGVGPVANVEGVGPVANVEGVGPVANEEGWVLLLMITICLTEIQLCKFSS